MVTLVHSPEGDWVGIYKDGVLLEEGHGFRNGEVLRVLGIEHEDWWDWDVEEDGFELPQSLEDVSRS